LVSTKFTPELLTESTKAQILSCFQSSIKHIESLIAEKERLNDLTKSEVELNAFDDKQVMFQRLNQLTGIDRTYEQILKAETDSKDLAEMLTDLVEGDEFGKVLVEDLKRLETKKFDLKVGMIQLLITEVIFFGSVNFIRLKN